MTRQPLRVLCLHGWRTNSRVLEFQTSALRHAFGSSADFVYVNAPWTASGPVPDVVRLFFGDSGPYYQWWDYQTHSSDSHSHSHCCCGSSNATRLGRSYHGFQRSLDYLTSQIDALGPFDAVLGFSQGAAMATLLTAHYLSRSPPSSLSSFDSLVPYKVCILVAGFDPETPETLEMLLDGGWASVEGALDVPSVHVVGTTDTLVNDFESQKLMQRFASSGRVRFEHDGGHEFPSRVECRQLYRDLAEHVLSITGSIADVSGHQERKTEERLKRERGERCVRSWKGTSGWARVGFELKL